MTTWDQPPLDIPDSETKTYKAKEQRNTEPQPQKCGQCGQLVRKAYLSGSAVDVNALGKEMSFEADPVIGGDFVFVGHIAWPVDQLQIPFFKEHRCPGFKS